jgi:hypothetical protein
MVRVGQILPFRRSPEKQEIREGALQQQKTSRGLDKAPQRPIKVRQNLPVDK